MYLWWSLCTLYACQVKVTVGDSGLLLLYLCYVFRVLINSLVCSLIFLLKSFLFNFLVETLQAVKYADMW